MTLPTIAGVQSRIHTTPDRPPFMLIREIAEVFGIEVRNLARQFQRTKDRFPADFYFVLTAEEYREQLAKSGQTVERSRTDLDQYAFTEQGALFLLRFVASEQADAASILLIRVFVTQRGAQAEQLRTVALKCKAAYIGSSKMKRTILLAAEEGWTFGKLWGEHDWSAPALGRTIEEMRLLGYIPRHALFVPRYVFALDRRRAEMANLDVHSEDDRKARLGLEG
jgi:hypothetical protein